MERSVLLVLSLTLCSLTSLSQPRGADEREYSAVEYTVVSDTTIVTIQTLNGEKLIFQVPPATFLAIYYSNPDTNKSQFNVFYHRHESISDMKEYHGRLSIRTRPSNELPVVVKADDLMQVVPVRLDFADATLRIHKKK